MTEQRILIVGANGQLGTALTKRLREKYGIDSVITSDLTVKEDCGANHEILDANDKARLTEIVRGRDITQIYHLAAILSAKGEEYPIGTWETNIKSLLNVLDVSSEYGIEKVFFPSSIAVFGNDAKKWGTPQHSPLNPATVYGMSKVAGEHWVYYYFSKYGLDVRSLRFPGIIGHDSLPGGGTTDYAVEIFHKAIQNKPFTCYLKEDLVLPMIYMEDAVRATIQLMEAPKENIRIRTSYNLQSFSFTPKELTDSIRQFYPGFKVTHTPDFRQNIAEGWPFSLDDTPAREDWSWAPKFQLDDMTAEMIRQLTKAHLKNRKLDVHWPN